MRSEAGLRADQCEQGGDRADCVTHEQGSVDGRAELKAKADNLFFTFTRFSLVYSA